MSDLQTKGWPTVVPRIITNDVAGLVAFVKVVFEANGELQIGRPTEIRIGDSLVMISDGGGLRQMWPAFLYIYVQSIDDTYQRAMVAGAQSIEEPADTPYGHRRAMIEDAWGNMWQIATPLR